MKPALRGMGDHSGTTEQSDFDPKNCAVRVSVDIGPDDEAGANYFHIQVVTPAYLSSHQKPMWGKSVLVVHAFSWDEIERAIEEMLSRITADTWEEAVQILIRYMDWEYEGMKGTGGKILIPYAGQNF